jgi:anthraniloyl-CoA monooxygenase
MWRNFPDDPQQAMGQGQHGAAGDAKATAHFDRLRHQVSMEDAIALADAMHRAPTVHAALQC